MTGSLTAAFIESQVKKRVKKVVSLPSKIMYIGACWDNFSRRKSFCRNFCEERYTRESANEKATDLSVSISNRNYKLSIKFKWNYASWSVIITWSENCGWTCFEDISWPSEKVQLPQAIILSAYRGLQRLKCGFWILNVIEAISLWSHWEVSISNVLWMDLHEYYTSTTFMQG